MDQDDRTAPPTERRRRQAREQGLGPRSHDLVLACRLLGIAAAFQFCGASLVNDLAHLISDAFTHPVEQLLSVDAAVSRLSSAVLSVALNVACFVFWILGASLVGRLSQVGFRFDLAAATPDVARISPANGLSKMFRLENIFFSLGNLTKFLLLTGAGGWFVWSHAGQLSILMEADLADGGAICGTHLLSLIWQLAIVQLVIGGADYAWQYWKFEQSLQMTAEEVRAEQQSRT